MSILANAWISLGRLARRRGRDRGTERWDNRRAWIRGNAAGRSFADVGGLFAVAGDVALLAEESGAEPVTLFDAGDAEKTEFPAKASERDSKVRVVQGDLEDPEAVRQIGRHDIVWCTGVIYHTPNPVRQLMHLREITGELLFLGTHTVPELPGLPGACVFYPQGSDDVRRAVMRAHKGKEAPGLGLPFDDRPMQGHANFWWGISASALRAMLAVARFEVVEEFWLTESPFLLDVVARPVDRPPVLPPPSYFRERAEARGRGDAELPWESFYEETGRGYV